MMWVFVVDFREALLCRAKEGTGGRRKRNEGEGGSCLRPSKDELFEEDSRPLVF